jgi:hypothetical protein
MQQKGGTHIVTTPEVDGKLHQLYAHLLAELPRCLPDNLAGLYLRGSLVTGDFRPESSDVDLLAVTHQRVRDEEFARLAALHTAIAASDHPFAQRIEIEYIDRAALRHYVAGQRFPGLGQGEPLMWHEHGANWVLERWLLRAAGIALFGPLPVTLIDPIARDEVVAATHTRLQQWAAWAANRDDPEWQWPRRHKFYVVETVCRALHTLATGEIVSKPRAVAWARQTLPAPWPELVARSRAWQLDSTRDDSLIAPVRAFVLWAADQPPGGE